MIDFPSEPLSSPRGFALTGSNAFNCTIAEIANQYVAAELPEIEAGGSNTPWRIQLPLACESADQVSIGVELIHESVSGTSDVVMLRGVLKAQT